MQICKLTWQVNFYFYKSTPYLLVIMYEMYCKHFNISTVLANNDYLHAWQGREKNWGDQGVKPLGGSCRGRSKAVAFRAKIFSLLLILLSFLSLPFLVFVFFPFFSLEEWMSPARIMLPLIDDDENK